MTKFQSKHFTAVKMIAEDRLVEATTRIVYDATVLRCVFGYLVDDLISKKFPCSARRTDFGSGGCRTPVRSMSTAVSWRDLPNQVKSIAQR